MTDRLSFSDPTDMAKQSRLKKQLRLSDVFVISSGAMFSSGFFLLPGIAASYTGASVVLAYLLAGVLMVPALLSQAELATAMPRAGGTYYFLDRTLGPLVGVISGAGTWLTLMLKSAFALIGMGAYLALVFDVPIKPIALACAGALGLLNLLGARESSRVVRVLVLALIAVLGFFIVDGLASIAREGFGTVHRERLGELFTEGVDGLLATVGLVFVSFIGLTKVVSLAEEVEDPERNLPLGMILSLSAVTGIYVLGVYVMLGTLGTEGLSRSLTPVADAARAFSTWLPATWAEGVIIVAAIAAFMSMANTGILASSRYPLAMARDHLLPERLAGVSRFGTPIGSVVFSTGGIVLFILVLNVTAVAKMASAMQLLLFALLNLAVIVMRESQIESYDPGFRSPLYPWVQIVGLVVPFFLVAEMGWLPALFVVGVVAACIPWYVYYARDRIARDGAIFHVFARLGRRRFAGLDRELRDIMKEKGVRAEDPFDEVVARAVVYDLSHASPRLSEVVAEAAAALSSRVGASVDELLEGLQRDLQAGVTPIAGHTALIHTRLPDTDVCEMVLVRSGRPLAVDLGNRHLQVRATETGVQAAFIMVSGDRNPGRHLRILAQLAARMDDETFIGQWLDADDEQDLKETLLRDDRFLSITLTTGHASEGLIGKALRELDMPEGCLVALVRRYGVTMVPRGRTVLREGDRLTVIGEPAGLHELEAKYTTDG